jgi:hypothetical protein
MDKQALMDWIDETETWMDQVHAWVKEMDNLQGGMLMSSPIPDKPPRIRKS